jgi:hypothetical protein
MRLDDLHMAQPNVLENDVVVLLIGLGTPSATRALLQPYMSTSGANWLLQLQLIHAG